MNERINDIKHFTLGVLVGEIVRIETRLYLGKTLVSLFCSPEMEEIKKHCIEDKTYLDHLYNEVNNREELYLKKE